LGIAAIDPDPQLIYLLWIKNANVEKEEKPDWVYISKSNNYTIKSFSLYKTIRKGIIPFLIVE
jgi:hypothetical protein